jgi:hypothetical protein
MRDALITGVVVGLFSLTGSVAGALIISHQLTRLADGSAGAMPVRSAEVAMSRLAGDPAMRHNQG